MLFGFALPPEPCYSATLVGAMLAPPLQRLPRPPMCPQYPTQQRQSLKPWCSALACGWKYALAGGEQRECLLFEGNTAQTVQVRGSLQCSHKAQWLPLPLFRSNPFLPVGTWLALGTWLFMVSSLMSPQLRTSRFPGSHFLTESFGK